MNSPDWNQTRFNAAVMEHLDVMHRMAYSLCRDRDLAEDVVQDAVLKAMRSYMKLRHEDNIRSWFARVVHTTCLDARRKITRRNEEPCIEEAEGETENFKLSPATWESEFIQDGFDDEIEGALDELPPEWRAVLLLVDVEGWSYEEVATSVESPIGTVRSRLFRARQKLYEILSARHLPSGKSGLKPVSEEGNASQHD